jgi:hypothetical protein
MAAVANGQGGWPKINSEINYRLELTFYKWIDPSVNDSIALYPN